MNEHAVNVLEFEAIRRSLAESAWSDEGRRRLAGAGFFREGPAVHACREVCAAFRDLMLRSDDPPSPRFPEIGPCLNQLAKEGAVAEVEELFALMNYLRQAESLKAWLRAGGSILREIADRMGDFRDLSRRLRDHIGEDGAVRENDIPSLRAIRSAIRAAAREIEARARAYMNASDMQGYWQSDVASQKDGRIVLPLNANYRGRLQGVVYETSASGATVFFEPLDIFEKNNELVREENRYRQEIFRILRELSEAVRRRSGELTSLYDVVADADIHQCRARYSLQHDCFPAAISQDRLELNGARHPLLGARAVPIDVRLDGDCRALLISGPNTGGKTVALKTVGLLALMNQFGMDVPADEGCILPLFDEVFVDIGDEQSISASLSTFSAHLTNLSGIHARATRDSLVLLDELGSGTDPEQGAALAMAFLDEFLARGMFFLSTTHLGALKRYAMGRHGLRNAAVDFDSASLRPLYRIVNGVPGGSHALEIAARLEVPSSILARAEAYARDEETDVVRIMNGLVEQQKLLTDQQRMASRRSEELQAGLAALAHREEELAVRERELKAEGLVELRRFLSTARSTLEGLIKELREGDREAEIRTVTQARQNLADVEQRSERLARELEASRPRRSHRAPVFAPGMDVLVGDKRRPGVLKRRVKQGWLVSVGALTLTVAESDLHEAASRSLRPAHVAIVGSDESAVLELDVRGMRAEDAERALSRQLDRAILQGLMEWSVIHGLGEGILQSLVRDFLKHNPAVASYGFAAPQEGGFGKTWVRMRS